MSKFFKRVGRGMKKFAKSKVGKIALIGAGVAGAAVGGGALLAAAKGGKLAKLAGGIGKGLGKKKAGLKLGKGLFGKLKGKQADQGGTVMKNGLSRMARRLKKRAARMQDRLSKKQAKLDIKKMQADQAVLMARESLGGGSLPDNVKDEVQAEIENVKNEAQNYVDGSIPDEPEGNENSASASLVSENRGMRLSDGNDTLKKLATGAAIITGASLLFPQVRKKIFG